jgi:choline dehydrogenase-like flavoprotein
MSRIVVVGAGVVGLGTAMLLAGDGHQVIVLERDQARPSGDPAEVWERWQRPGVNQFRLAHVFLAGFRSVLEAELPDVAGANSSHRVRPASSCSRLSLPRKAAAP